MVCSKKIKPLLICVLTLLLSPTASSIASGDVPVPSPWPDKFHALLYMNQSTGNLQITNLWYDWPSGRNVNLIQKQLGALIHDVEWDNGTSFYYTLGGEGGACTCEVMRFPVGIPRRDFMVGATYLGRKVTDGFLCDVWEKVDFIWYYEDVATKRPVRWDFYDGIITHVMAFEVGAILDESKWQAPACCFNGEDGHSGESPEKRRQKSQNIESTRNPLHFSPRKLS